MVGRETGVRGDPNQVSTAAAAGSPGRPHRGLAGVLVGRLGPRAVLFVVAMLQRKGGVSLTEIMQKMCWQKHTVRGCMAGAMKKAGYAIESFKPEGGGAHVPDQPVAGAATTRPPGSGRGGLSCLWARCLVPGGENSRAATCREREGRSSCNPVSYWGRNDRAAATRHSPIRPAPC